MCRFVVFNYKEFKNPVEVFILGVLVVFSNILGQITNAAVLLQQTSVEKVISKFVYFKVLFQIQDYYLRSKTNLKFKDAIKDPLIIIPNKDVIFGSKTVKKVKNISKSIAKNNLTPELIEYEKIKEKAPKVIVILFYI